MLLLSQKCAYNALQHRYTWQYMYMLHSESLFTWWHTLATPMIAGSHKLCLRTLALAYTYRPTSKLCLATNYNVYVSN